MKVAFGISLSPGTPLLQEKDTRRFIDLAKMADDYGAEAVGTHSRESRRSWRRFWPPSTV